MNKYQKEINKLTKHYISARKKELKEKYKSLVPNRANDKSMLTLYRIIQIGEEYNRLNSNRYYRYIKKGVKKDINVSLNLPLQNFKMEFDYKWDM